MDFATLSIGADTSELRQANKALDDLVASGARAEAAAEGVENAVRGAGDAGAEAAGGISAYERALAEAAGSFSPLSQGATRSTSSLNDMSGASRLSSSELTNLTFQLQDLGVQLASGGNPLIALVQQGSQVSGIMMQAGLGVKGFAREVAVAMGIIKVSGNAGLAAAAQAAAANQAAIATALQRAEADIVAATAEQALARAAIANATTAAESATAQLALASATNAASQASARAAAASTALAEANAASAAASSASTASQVTTLGRMGVIGLGAAAALGAVAAATALLTKEVNDNTDVQVSWQNVLLGAYDTIADSLTGMLASAFQALGIDATNVWQTIAGGAKTAFNFLIGASTLGTRLIAAGFRSLGPSIGNGIIAGANFAINGINSLVQGALSAINSFADALSPILERVGLSLPRLVVPKIPTITFAFAAAGESAGEAFGSAITDTWRRDYIGDFAGAISGNAVKRQLAQNASDAGKEAGKAGGAAMGRAMGEAAADAFPQAFEDALARQADLASRNAAMLEKQFADRIKRTNDEATATAELNAEHRRRIEELGLEYRMLGQSNAVREKATLLLEREAYVTKYGTAAWEEYYKARVKIIDQQSAMEREAQLIGELAGAFEGLAGLIGGRAGRALGGILNLEIMVDDESGNKVAKRMSDVLAGAFTEGSGKLAQSITQAIANASIGVAASKSVLGGKGSSLGAGLGGAIGGELGSSILGPALGKLASGALGKALGSLGGPLGAIAGGILGGLVGGMLKSTPRASATVSAIGGQAMISAMQGNSSQLKGIATGLANGLIGGLQNIAAQFGGQIGDFGAISIGTRNDTFRVDPTGQGRTKNLQQFATQEEAIAEALRIAISRGAITGIRAGTDALLRMQGDLETNLQKALAFEGVFDRLAKETDPLNYELGKLQKEFDALKVIFGEARASTEEYAQLEQLFQIERTKIIERNTAAVDENGNAIEASTDALRERTGLEIRLLELQGNAVAALALSRESELATLDPANRALAQQIFALEDQAEAARIAAEAADALAQAESAIAQERFGLETRLLGLQGNTAALRERELAALDPANRAILANIFALEDQAAANTAATEAAAELARVQEAVAQERFNIEGQILQLLGDTAALRERELAAVDPSNRALLQRLFSIEDEQIATEAATAAANALAEAEQALAQERATLEGRLFELTATTAEQRERELAALAPANRAILERIFAVQDEQAAVEAATLAANALADAQRRISEERIGLEGRLLQLQGDTTALRERELASLDPSNRELLQRIFNLQDEQAAAELASQAAQDLAAANQRAAEVLARAQQAIADEVTGLQRRLLEAQGNTSAVRELELASLLSDEARAIQREIYRIEDAANAVSNAQDNGTRAADELAEAERRIAEERMGLTIRLLEAQGNATAALNLRREQEIASTDESNRALLRQIYVLEDAAEAQRAYEEAVSAAKSALEQSVDAERRAIEERLSPLRSELERLVSAITPDAPDLAAALQVQDFLGEGLDIARRLSEASRNVLGDTESVVAMQRDMARRELFRMAETRRINGDIIDQLISDATRFGDDFANPVDLLREQALTANLLADLARIQEEQAIASQAIEDARAEDARGAVLAQISALQAQIAIEEASLASLDAILGRFGLLNDGVLSVRDAVNNLTTLIGGPSPVVAMGPSGGVITTAPAAVAQRETQDAMNAELVKQNEYLRELVRSALKQERTLKEIELQGEAV